MEEVPSAEAAVPMERVDQRRASEPTRSVRAQLPSPRALHRACGSGSRHPHRSRPERGVAIELHPHLCLLAVQEDDRSSSSEANSSSRPRQQPLPVHSRAAWVRERVHVRGEGARRSLHRTESLSRGPSLRARHRRVARAPRRAIGTHHHRAARVCLPRGGPVERPRVDPSRCTSAQLREGRRHRADVMRDSRRSPRDLGDGFPGAPRRAPLSPRCRGFFATARTDLRSRLSSWIDRQGQPGPSVSKLGELPNYPQNVRRHLAVGCA
jgi:hypothetical protein